MKFRFLTLLLASLFGGLPLNLTAATSPTLYAVRAAGRTSGSVSMPSRPFVLASSSTLEQMRKRRAEGGFTTAKYQEVVSDVVDDWSARIISIPQRSGHYHHFTCNDGTRLNLPEKLMYGAEIPAGQEYQCRVCQKLYNGPLYDGGMRHAQHVALIGACRALAFHGYVEGHRPSVEKAAEILAKYADAYPGRHTSATSGGIFYQSLDESVHLITLAQAYDLVVAADGLSAAQREHIEQDLFWEAAEGFIKMGIGGNWGSWHLSAVGVIGYATGHHRMIEYGRRSIEAQLRHQLGNDGLWPESVHTYHFYPMRGFLALAECAANAGDDFYPMEPAPGQSLTAMFLQPLKYMYPDFRLPAINDGWFESFLPIDMYELGFARLRLPELATAVEGLRRQPEDKQRANIDRSDIWRLLFREEIPEQRETSKPVSTNFHNLGIAVLRNKDSSGKSTVATFDYGRFLGHGQADTLGVTLFAEGRVLSADYGTPSYGSGILPYYKGTASHNTVMVDGKDHAGGKYQSLLTFEDMTEVKVAVAETTAAASGVCFRRATLLFPDALLVVDRLRSEQQHTYDWLWHSEGETLEVGGDGANTLDFSDNTWFTDVKQWTCRAEVTGIVWTELQRPLLRAMVAAKGTSVSLFTGMCPAESGARQVPVAIHRVEGNDAEFAALFTWSEINSGSLVRETDDRLVLNEGGRTWNVGFDVNGIWISKQDDMGRPADFVGFDR